MFTTKISKDEANNTIITFYAKVAQEEVMAYVNEIVVSEIKGLIRKEVRALLEKPIKQRAIRELKIALGEEAECIKK